MEKNFWIVIALIVVGMISRFFFLFDGLAWLPNFSAIGAIALLGATYLKGPNRFLIPIGLFWISDMVLNNVFYSEYFESFQLFGDYWVLGSILLIGVLGYFVLQKRSILRLACASIGAALLFYLVTNFGVWAGGTLYPKDAGGLLASYIAGIPFLKNTLLSNLFYGFVFFGAYEWLANRTFFWSVSPSTASY